MKPKGLNPLAIPETYYLRLCHRIEPILDYWGRNCRWVTLQVMAFSCYSQGVMDGIQLIKQKGFPQEESDYEI